LEIDAAIRELPLPLALSKIRFKKTYGTDPGVMPLRKLQLC